MVVAVTIIGGLYSCSKSSDVLPSTNKPSTSAKSQLQFKKDPTGQFVDKSVQITGYEDGRQRPTRFKANPAPSKFMGGYTSNLTAPTDPGDGSGSGGIIYSNASVGPYKFVSSVGQGIDNSIPSNPYILDVEIAKGSDASVGPPSGYTKLDADLNSGAGGKYIYLCFSRREVADRTECLFISMKTPLTGITAIGWQTLSISDPPSKYCAVLTRDGTVFPWSFKMPDLNDGSGGRYIYAYESKYGSASPIREVGIVAGNNDQIQPPSGWVRVGDDLNMGAGGDYIYLCYKR